MSRKKPDDMEHEPVDRFSWEQLVRRAELAPTTKYVAGWLASYANRDGSSVRPGERLLADVLECKERSVREHLAKLRDLGLIEVVREAAPGEAAEYQLTFPGEGYPPVPMRLDPYGNRISERPVGRAGKRRPAKTGTRVPVDNSETGTPVPVNNPEDRHPGAGEDTPEASESGTRVPVDSSVHRHPGAASPAPGRTNDRHPGAAHQYRTKTRPPLVESYSTPTSAELGFQPAENDRSQEPAPDEPAAPPVADFEYAAANRFLRTLTVFERDDAITAARKELETEGLSADLRRITVRAAALLQTRDTA